MAITGTLISASQTQLLLPDFVNLKVTQFLIEYFKPYGLANQKLCCLQMLLNVEKCGDQY